MGSLYGFEVKTELPLRRLNRARGTRGTLTVAAASAPLAEPAGEPAGVLEDDAGRRWYASYETEAGCYLALPPTGAFMLEPRAARVTVDARDDDAELREHRLASSAICTLLAMRGDLVLHAAASRVGGRALVFCGPSQRGKSTLVRALGGAGFPVLAEDGLAISLQGEPTAFPGARGVRVRSAEGASVALAPDPGPEEPEASPVGAVVLLGERGAALEVEWLEPARALALLTPNLVHSGGRAAIGGAFGNLARLLRSAPAFRVTLPDDIDALPAAAQKFLDSTTVRGLDSSPGFDLHQEEER